MSAQPPGQIYRPFLLSKDGVRCLAFAKAATENSATPQWRAFENAVDLARFVHNVGEGLGCDDRAAIFCISRALLPASALGDILFLSENVSPGEWASLVLV
jgi:hypothetical protein